MSRRLAEIGIRPSRRLGQCFLADANLAEAIVAGAELEPGELVLEVGPGLGALTDRLLDRGHPVLAIEIDPRLAEELEHRYRDRSFTLVRGDVLASKHQLAPELLSALARASQGGTKPFSLVANLPYAVSVPVILLLLQLPVPPRRMTVMVQLEVAERLVAGPGDDAYGASGILAQALARVELQRRVPREVFVPRPEIESAVVRVDPIPPGRRLTSGVSAELQRVLRDAFQHRRRQIRGTLQRLWPDRTPAGVEEHARRLGISTSNRPEDLPVDVFVRLAFDLGGEPTS